MSTIANVSWQTGFLNVLPAVETHARIQFRRLPVVQREEAIQEAIASACSSYQLLAARGKLDVAHPGTLATFAVNHVRGGRHVGGSQDAARDALSPAAQRRHRFRTLHCDRLGRYQWQWQQAVVADRRYSIADAAAFRIDFADWLRSLSRRDRSIIAAFIAGERTGAVAGRFGISQGRVSQLRRRYQQDGRCISRRRRDRPAAMGGWGEYLTR